VHSLFKDVCIRMKSHNPCPVFLFADAFRVRGRKPYTRSAPQNNRVAIASVTIMVTTIQIVAIRVDLMSVFWSADSSFSLSASPSVRPSVRPSVTIVNCLESLLVWFAVQSRLIFDHRQHANINGTVDKFAIVIGYLHKSWLWANLVEVFVLIGRTLSLYMGLHT
jgi:hypothetical protein